MCHRMPVVHGARAPGEHPHTASRTTISQLSGTGAWPAMLLRAVGVEVLVRRSCPSYGAGVGTPVYPSPLLAASSRGAHIAA
ncbi:hypothetical protein H4W31_003160 [Plantactinospora soyae]|uniref:Uncharacterized protein n=1 Tax=Plantactinospora soyae TaxID=1544732 RepID=A0A927M3S6_9ACTN|nr:hypothetical protein [Plantactinospora soyae]